MDGSVVIALYGASGVIAITLAMRRLKKRHPMAVFYGLHAVFLGFWPAIGKSLSISPEFVPYAIQLQAASFSLVAVIAFWVGEKFVSVVVSRRATPSSALAVRGNNGAMAVFVPLAIGLVGFIVKLALLDQPFGSILSTPRLDLRYEGPPIVLLIVNALPAALMIAAYQSLIRRYWWVWVLILAVTLLMSQLTGTRSFLLFAVGPLVYYLVTRAGRGRYTLAALILTGMLGLVLIATLHLSRWSDTRSYQSLYQPLASGESAKFLTTNKSSDLNLSGWLEQIVESFPRDHDWLYGKTFGDLAWTVLPRSLFDPTATSTKAVHIYAYVVTGRETDAARPGSVHPSWVGDLYANFGGMFWLGAVGWGLALGYLARFMTTKPHRFSRQSVQASWVYVAALVFRGSIQQAFVPMMFVFSLSVLLVVLGEILANRNTHPQSTSLPGMG